MLVHRQWGNMLPLGGGGHVNIDAELRTLTSPGSFWHPPTPNEVLHSPPDHWAVRGCCTFFTSVLSFICVAVVPAQPWGEKCKPCAKKSSSRVISFLR